MPAEPYPGRSKLILLRGTDEKVLGLKREDRECYLRGPLSADKHIASPLSPSMRVKVILDDGVVSTVPKLTEVELFTMELPSSLSKLTAADVRLFREQREKRGNGYRFSLSGKDLSYAALSYSDLSESCLANATFYRTDLWGANLNNADLGGANLHLATLEGSSMIWTNLIGADLRRANLRGAALHGADLRHADLTGADVEDAIGWKYLLLGGTKADERLKQHIINEGRNRCPS